MPDDAERPRGGGPISARQLAYASDLSAKQSFATLGDAIQAIAKVGESAAGRGHVGRIHRAVKSGRDQADQFNRQEGVSLIRSLRYELWRSRPAAESENVIEFPNCGGAA